MKSPEFIYKTYDIFLFIAFFMLAVAYLFMAIRSKADKRRNALVSAWSLCYTVRFLFCACYISVWATAIANMIALIIAVIMLRVDRDKRMIRTDIIYLVVGILLLMMDIPDLVYVEKEIYDGIRDYKVYLAHTI